MAREDGIDAGRKLAVDAKTVFGVIEGIENFPKFGIGKIPFYALKRIEKFGDPTTYLKAFLGALDVFLQRFDLCF